MIKDKPNTTRMLGLGLDDQLIFKIKKTVREQKFKLRFLFSDDYRFLPVEPTKIDMILVQLTGAFTQNLKIVHELVFQYPNIPLVLLSKKGEPEHLVQYFRAGVYDILFIPIDDFELAGALRRLVLRPRKVSSLREWTPLQAAAHFFTRPITDQWDDLADNIDRYFSLFLEVTDHKRFLMPGGIDEFVCARYELNESDKKLLHDFLNNPQSDFLGLKKYNNRLSWMIKLAPDFICYWSALDRGKSTFEEIFGTHFRNMLKGQKRHYLDYLEHQRMKLLALTDEITGLWNQRKLTKDLEERVVNRSPFALLFIDIDFFKTVNDQFGHVHGSQLLIDMASILRKELRDSDMIFRYGGDEFIVLLPKADLGSAKITALRLSQSIKAHEFNVQEKPYKLSLSIGIAVYPDDANSARSLIDFADQMMYMSKKSGRGKVFHVTEVMS
jgi:diguanylate cyclase (GGDEF)-like protein